MSRVWEYSKHSGTDLLMLLALADYSDDAGNSYPAVGTLATKCRMQPRNATYILKALQASGELVVRPNEGPKGTNRYRIALETLQGIAGGVQGVAGAEDCTPPLQSSASPPATHCALPLQPVAPKPSGTVKEPSENRQGNARTRAAAPQCPPDVDQQTWTDWLALRRAKKAPVTPTVVASAMAEAAKAGMHLEGFLRVWCARGSQGLQADWLKPAELQQSVRARERSAAFDEWTGGRFKSFAEHTTAAKAARYAEMTGGLVGATAPGSPRSDVIDLEPSDGTPRRLV